MNTAISMWLQHRPGAFSGVWLLVFANASDYFKINSFETFFYFVEILISWVIVVIPRSICLFIQKSIDFTDLMNAFKNPSSNRRITS